MFHPPAGELPPPRAGVVVERVPGRSCEFYRQLYRSIGADLCWVNRLAMPDEQLQAILSDDRVEVFVLRVEGELAGYSELYRRVGNEVELAYFGLIPRFIGQGLGKWLLDWTIRAAWSRQPARVWVHTCDLDHPAALPTYVKAGFQSYHEEIVSQFVPAETTEGLHEPH